MTSWMTSTIDVTAREAQSQVQSISREFSCSSSMSKIHLNALNETLLKTKPHSFIALGLFFEPKTSH